MNQLYLAFSRDNPKEKVYIQNLMQNDQNSHEIWDLIYHQNGTLYVCGGSTKPRNIKDCIIDIAQKHGKMSLAKAKGFVKKLQDKHRYIQELWS